MKFFLILCYLIGSVHGMYAMGGAVCGVIVPVLVGPYYMACSSKPMKKKLGEWAKVTLANAALGGMTHLYQFANLA